MGNEDRKMFAGTAFKVLGSIVLLWAGLVVVFAFQPNDDVANWDYTRTGQFGDSFGIIGTIMAATAAYFAYRTYRAQAEETRLLRLERAEAARLRAEPSFLNLLERRYDAIKQFTYLVETTTSTG